MDHIQINALWDYDSPDGGPLVLSGPFQSQLIITAAGLLQNGGFPVLSEGQAHIKMYAGVLAVGRMGPDFGDEKKKIKSVGKLALLGHTNAEGEAAVVVRDEGQARPGGPVQSADVDIFPGIVDFSRGSQDKSEHRQK